MVTEKLVLMTVFGEEGGALLVDLGKRPFSDSSDDTPASLQEALVCLGFARYVLTLVRCRSYRREPWETRMTTGAAFAVLALPLAEVLNRGGAYGFPSFTFTRTSQDLQMATLLQKRVKSQFRSKSEEHGGEMLMDRRTEISPVAIWAGGQCQAGPNIWHNHKEKLP